MEKSERIKTYHDAYLGDYDFESVQVKQRQRMVLELIKESNPRTVVEVGCGVDLLYTRALEHELPISKWVIVEPNSHFSDIAESEKQGSIKKYVVRKFFEDSVEQIREIHDTAIDLVLFSGVLTDVPDPEALIIAAKALMNEDSVLHVAVPSASSLHRQLALAMGLISDLKDFSSRNKSLNAYKVYDMETLRQLIEGTGLTIEGSGGYFLKPFTHAQMAGIKDLLSDEMLAGLWRLGQEYPELASEIFINAKLKA